MESTENCARPILPWSDSSIDLAIEQYAPAQDSVEAGFFQSATWLRNYVGLWPQTARYGVIHEPLVFLSCAPKISKFGVKYRSIGYNELLAPEYETIQVEENGFYFEQLHSFAADFEILASSLLRRPDWDELSLSALNETQASVVAAAATKHRLLCSKIKETDTYWVDLGEVRTRHSGDFLGAISANSRYQLRKSKRVAESTLGPLNLEVAKTVPQALAWLSALGALHQKRWGFDNPLEGFNNPRFVAFHDQMVKACHQSGEVELIRLSAGEHVLAYLFNYVHKGRVFFTMSGIDYDHPAAIRPGMLAHWCAIEHHLKRGSLVYDFLKGTNRYKDSLSTHRGKILSITLRRRSIHFLVEHVLRKSKHRIESFQVSAKDSWRTRSVGG